MAAEVLTEETGTFRLSERMPVKFLGITPNGRCSACETLYSSPFIQDGTRHRGCAASPAGRFWITKKSKRKLGRIP